MKIAYILALLAVIATGVLGYMNRTREVERRQKKDEIARQILKDFDAVKATNESAQKVIEDYVAKSETLRMETNQSVLLTREINDLVTQIEAHMKDTTRTKEEEDAINAKVKELLGEFGTPEEITAKREELIKKVEELRGTKAIVEKELEITRSLVAENEKTIEKLKGQQGQRSKEIALESKEGIINAVNPDWAFVIINMGKNQGVTPTTRLMVKRGSLLVGRLNPIQVDDTLTVADIDQKSLKAGVSVMPGDQVIFDNDN